MSRLQHLTLLIAGKFVRRGYYFQVLLGAEELRRLSAAVKQAAAVVQPLYVEVGDGRLVFTYGSSTGEASAIGNVLTIRSNRVDLVRLADDFQEMAGNADPELEGLVHLHLEPVYIACGHNVSDVVFERLEPANDAREPAQ